MGKIKKWHWPHKPLVGPFIPEDFLFLSTESWKVNLKPLQPMPLFKTQTSQKFLNIQGILTGFV
jgi:hypothetical protein